jgi:hypothetical protein
MTTPVLELFCPDHILRSPAAAPAGKASLPALALDSTNGSTA